MSSDIKIHTPYDGSSKPFTIGLSQLDDAQWLDEDENLVRYLDEKLSLYKTLPNKVMVEDEGTRDAQSEVLAIVQSHVLKHCSALYQRDGNVMRVANQHSVQLDDEDLSPLSIAALLVQEDLVLMRKSSDGWKLAAASLCFPSAWNLLEKFKKPLHQIHSPVPEFGEGTRNASLIERMFDNLDPARSVLRWNWSLHGDDRLYHPASDNNMKNRFGAGDDITGRVIIRLERQTLRKLPQSGDILFTIRIYNDPLEALLRHAEGKGLARSIEQQIMALTDDQIAYKGLTDERARLCARLRAIAEQATQRSP